METSLKLAALRLALVWRKVVRARRKSHRWAGSIGLDSYGDPDESTIFLFAVKVHRNARFAWCS